LSARRVTLRKMRWRPDIFWYCLLFVGLVAAVLVTEVWSETSVGRVYGANLVAELVGIIITVFVVTRLIQAQRERTLAPIRRHALNRTGGAFTDLVMRLIMMYKSASPSGHLARPRNLDEFLSEWPKVVPRLDFLSAYLDPMRSEPSTPLDFYREQFERISSEITDSIDRYTEALGVRLVDLLETLLADPTFTMFLKVNLTDEMRVHQREFVGPYLMLGSRTAFDQRDAFIGKVRALAKEYTKVLGGPRLDDERFLTVPLRDDVAPPWGVNRYDGILHPRLTERVTFGPPGGPLPRLPVTPRVAPQRLSPQRLFDRLRQFRRSSERTSDDATPDAPT
jgi:hypothetical protein